MKRYQWDGGFQALAHRNGEAVEVVRPLKVPDEADAEVGPMFEVKFADGETAHVYEDEIVEAGHAVITPAESDGKVYVVTGPYGFTESFSETTVETLVRLGLIKFEREDYVMVRSTPDGDDVGHGPLHRFYVATGKPS